MIVRTCRRAALAGLSLVVVAAGVVAVESTSTAAAPPSRHKPQRVFSRVYTPPGKPKHSERKHPATKTLVTVRRVRAHAGTALPRHGTSVVSSTALTSAATQGSASALVAVASPQPTAPFTECPAIGNATSCDVLVQVTDNQTVVLDDPTQGPYDGSDDTLVGVINNSSTAVTNLVLSSNTDLFGFDGDGLCTYSPIQPGCPFGTTGYEGPNTSFSNINNGTSGGTVNFTSPLQPGQTAYFSLEERLAASSVFAGGPNVNINGHATNPSVNPTTCSTGWPVNCATGDFWHTFTDSSVPGRGVPLLAQRTYDAAQADVDGPFGFGWTSSYGMSLSIDSSGAATINQENGSEVVFQPNVGGGWIAPPWVKGSLVTNPDGSYTFTRRPSHVSFTFSSTGQLTAETDRNGYLTTLSYVGGQLTTVADPAGRTLTFGYTGSHVTSLTDPMGRKTVYIYDAAGNLASATDAAGRAWTFGYDANHLLTAMTDPRGGATSNVYDSSNRVTTQTDPAGRKTGWSYVGNPATGGGGTTTITDPNGNVTVEDYTNLELQDITHGAGTPQAATTKYAYDQATLGVSALTDPNGNVTTNSYDADGNLLSSTDPLNRTTGYSYDALDNVLSKTTPAGRNTSYSYDGNGNLTAVIDPAGNSTSFSYGDATHPGDVTTATDRDGRVTTLTYDANGDVASSSVSPSSGVTNTTRFVYDADGERTCLVSANATAAGVSCQPAGGATVANTTATIYDVVGQVTSITDPNGHTTSYGYDGNGNRIKVTDANGHVTGYAFDANNELTTVTRGDGTTTSYSYDNNGNRTASTDGAGNATTYTYDALNRQISSTDPLGRTTTSGYDAAGNHTTTTDPAGRTTANSYNAANQLTAVSYSSGTSANVGYQYDADGNRAAMSDSTGSSTYAYDALDRLTGSTNGAGATVLYGYDKAGHVTTLTYPSGQVVTNTYDSAGRQTATQDWLGKTFTYGYDANGNETSQADPNGITAASTYDNADQLMAITDKTGSGTLASFTYSRDNLGQLTASAPTGVTGASNETYSYTSLNQLANTNTNSYSYDHADNLVKLADGTTQTFDAANELTSSTPPATTPPPSKLAADQIVSADQKSFGSKVTSPVVKTTSGNELLLAFVSADGPKTGTQTITNVTGGGLTWTLASRANGALGTAEVWQAYATNTISSAITAKLGVTGYDASVTVMTFTGATAAIGATASAGAKTGAPSVKITPANDSSILLAAGHDWDHSALVTPAAGQTLVHLTRDTHVHDSFWTQRVTAPTTKNTAVTVADTTPTTDRWELAAVEVPAASPSSGSGSTGTPTTYTYDSQGNRTGSTTGSTTTSLTFDQANRLTGYGPNATYSYNGDGLRQAKTVSGSTTSFVWDLSRSLPLLLQDGADSYVHGPDGMPVEKISGTTPTYLLHDQQGSIRLLSDATGSIVGAYTYDPYGKVTTHTGSATVSLQYDGQYTDAETGLQYLRSRYYDPPTGQFLSVDPIVSATQAAYGFALNDPLNIGDPSGLIVFNLGAAVIGGAIGAIVGGVVAVATDYATGHTEHLGADVAGGILGGAIGGACIGFTFGVASVTCGAVAGGVGELTTEALVGQGFNPEKIGLAFYLGGLFSAIRDPFPLQGRRPFKLSNVLQPAKNATREYKNALVKGGATSLITTLVC